MTQTIENWSRVTGRVERWTPPTGPDGHGELVVRVERVADVKGFPNLLEKAEGTTLRIRVPASGSDRLDGHDGGQVSVDVRRVKDRAVVYASPESIRIRG